MESLAVALVVIACLNFAGLVMVGYWTQQTNFLLRELVKYARAVRKR